jgi:tetratricopeptide (TPR) repeat protein
MYTSWQTVKRLHVVLATFFCAKPLKCGTIVVSIMETAVIGGSDKASKGRLSKRNLIIAGAVLIVLVVIGLIILRFSAHKKSPAVSTAITNAERAFAKGDYDKAYSLSLAALPQARSNTDKARLYDQLAICASSGGKVTDAIKYYGFKHQVDLGSVKSDAYALGTLYDRNGQSDKALEQYKIALAYMKTLPKNMQNTNDTAALQLQITGMEK